ARLGGRCWGSRGATGPRWARGGRSFRARLAPVQEQPVAAGSEPPPGIDARDGGSAGARALRDVGVVDPLVEKLGDLPAVRERMELRDRAEVPKEALGLFG